jgi:hypothetical protein
MQQLKPKQRRTYVALSPLLADGGTPWTQLLLGVAVSAVVPGSAKALPMAWAPRLLITILVQMRYWYIVRT